MSWGSLFMLYIWWFPLVAFRAHSLHFLSFSNCAFVAFQKNKKNYTTKLAWLLMPINKNIFTSSLKWKKKKNNYLRLYKKKIIHIYVSTSMSICTLHVGVLHMLKKSDDYSEKTPILLFIKKNYFVLYFILLLVNFHCFFLSFSCF